MKHLPLISSFCSTPRRKLYMAIAAQMIVTAGAHASPNGGTVVGGDGIIEQSGLDTTIIQNTGHLAIDWESFNIAAEERVQFIQPDADSVALNRILGSEASQIFGRLDANGHVILMNPNGVLFGEGASVNVGGLVASGLNINADDFMNGDYVLRAVDGKDGTVINNGIINAATGGNVALIGKQVDNQGLISAKLGAVTLAAGKEAVLTFDNQGLLGVRVSKEILQDELGVNAAITNSGDISAEGGRVLITGSVSQDIFSQAVNAEGLNAKTSVVMHEDGSFTLGAGADVLNTGTISTSSDTTDAGQIVVLGENVNSSGAILANSKTANAAGNIEIHSRDTTLLTEQSQTSATNGGAGSGGQIKILGDRVGILDQSQINTSGTKGGGDINIGGGFQGKELQLRNATRTVVGKETLIEANAITDGKGGDVILWADETASFTGEINVRGGELGGDGGFVEVSGKKNLRFLGSVDRTAVRGENGTLLLDPDTVLIVPESLAEQDDELSDGEILLSEEPTLFIISDAAISNALSTGDVFIRATQTITANEFGLRIAVDDPTNTSSLVLESGGSVYFSGEVEIDLGAGDLIAVGSIDGLCETCLASDITLFNQGTINTTGNIYFLSSRYTTIVGANIGRDLDGEQTSTPDNIYVYAGDEAVLYLDSDLEIAGSIRMETLARPTLTSITLPSGATYEVPDLKTAIRDQQGMIFDVDAVLGRKAEITVGEGIFIDSDFIGGTGVEFTEIVVNSNTETAQFVINSKDAVYLPEIGYDSLGNTSSSISIDVSSEADIYAEENISTLGGSLSLKGANINIGESISIDTTGLADQGDISFETIGDINLGIIISGGDLNVESSQGSVAFGESVSVAGEINIIAEDNVSFLETLIFLPGNNVYLTAGNDINFAASSNVNDLGYIELAESNPASFIFNAGRNVVIDSTLMLGSGDLVASAGTRAHSPSDFPLAIADANFVVRSHEGPGIYAKAIDTNGKIIFRSAHFIDTPMLESGANGVGGYIGYYTDGSVVLPHYANSNGHFEVFNYSGAENLISTFKLSDGSTIELPSIVSFEAVDAGYVGWYGSGVENTLATSGGNFYIEARKIQHWGGNALDVSSSSGHGNITLIAAEEMQAPPIIYSNMLGQGAVQLSEIRLSASKIRIDRDIDFNNAGVVDFSLDASADVILGVVEDDMHYLELPALDRRVGGQIFDSVGGDTDQLNIEITSGGTVFQKYDLFTGGGNYSAAASEFHFNDGVQVNTDFANASNNSLFGDGNISLTETIIDPAFNSRLILPDIQTQAECSGDGSCGNLVIRSTRHIYDGEPASGNVQLKIAVSGDSIFESDGIVNLLNEQNDIRFDGGVSVKASIASFETRGGFELLDWIVGGTIHLWVLETEGRSSDLVSYSTLTGEARTILSTPGELILRGEETRFNTVELEGSRIELQYKGDLILDRLILTGGSSGEASLINVDGSIMGSDRNWLNIAGNIVDDIHERASPVILDVTGDVLLSSTDNKISSIQILNAQNVEIFNNDDLTLDGVNAENLTLNVLGDIEQTAALNILGSTNINASVGANINLLDPLNDFDSLNVQSAGPAIINIADANSISLGDIDLNGASQGGALSVGAAAITQEENGRILLQDAARLNLQADYITLGANGTASVDILGSALNGVFTRDLNIQGLVRGGTGAAGTGVAGFYFNGSVEDNFFEVADGASITGDFISGSNIYLGDGNDTVSLAGDVAIPVEGGAGQDTFFIEAANLSIAQIYGNEDQDILVGPDAHNVWSIGADGGDMHSNGLAVSNFGGFESIRGGNQTDDFVVGSPAAALQLDGGDGLDSLSANFSDPTINNQWLIDGINSGSLNELVLFSAVENLIGNDGADTVTFAEGAQIGDVSTGLGDDEFTLVADITTGLLDAGDGDDTLNLNGLTSTYSYLNELISGNGAYKATNFETENNEGGSKTIVGVDGYDAEWIIEGEGSVTISALQGGMKETNRFTGVTRVEGASGNDTFILQGGYLADRIVGGQGGSDSLIADTSLNNNWLLNGPNSGKVQVVDAEREQIFEAITNLVGGGHNDIFNILSGADFDGTISGGEGANSLVVLDPTATSVWTIASTNELRVESLNNAVSQLTFSEIQTLVGHDNEDVLDLSAVAGSVDLQQQTASGAAIPTLSIQGFDEFISNGGGIVGANSNSTWVLNDLSEVSYQDETGVAHQLSFSGFQNIYGGTGEDYFRIDGRWFANAGAIYAGTLSETLDTAELNISGTSAWSFNSNDSTAVYTGLTDPGALFSATRTDALNTLDDSPSGAFYLSGIERNLGSEGDDVFLVYGDSDLYSPYVDGRDGNDYLLAYNWGTPEDLVWNVTEDYGGDINAAVQFRNFENLRSFDFFDAETRGVASRFNVSAGVEIGSLIGDSTNTSFNIGAQARIGSISDNGGTDTVNVSEGTNAWQLNEAGGSLNTTTFSSIEILNGGSGSDNFTVASATTEVLQIDGGSGVNSLTAFNQDNTWTLSASTSTLNEIRFNNITNLIGNAGVDTFVIADSGLALGIDGGGGVDELRGSDQLNNWLVDGTYAGTLNESILFSGVEHLQGGTLADDFTVTAGSSIGQTAGGDGDDTISFGTGASAIYILGEAGSDRVELGDLVNITGYLDGGEGDLDILDISAFTGAFEFDFSTETTNTGLTYSNFEQEVLPATGTSFFGGDGNTRWTFAEDNSFLIEKLDENGEVVKSGTYNNYSAVRGGVGVNKFVMSSEANFDGAIRGDASGNNSLTAADLVNLWIINGQNQGQLQVDGAAEITLFSNIANLIGGASADSFEIANGGSVTGSIDGGAGNDRLVITDTAAVNDWLLATQNSVGLVAQFRDIEALRGNANKDTFTFSGATAVTSIDGAGDDNAVIWRADDVAINLGTAQINNAIAFSSINSFDADSAFANTLIGADESNTWTLNAASSGTIENAFGSTAFSGFQNLVGGAMADAFMLTTEATDFISINGEAGVDSLSAADQLNQWVLDAEGGELNGLRFANIEALTGGALQDNFVLADAASQAQIFDGGAGVNRLTAYDQVNVWNVSGDNAGDVTGLTSFSNIQTLIGGAQADTFTLAAGVNLSEIYAGAGNDLFVIGAGVVADNFYGEAGDDSVEVEVGLELSGVLDGGSGGETDGDYINLNRYTLLDATAELESVLGFAFLNFERIDEPNNQGVYFGGDGTNFWYITGTNEGRLEIREGEDAGVYEFSGVHSLLGGEGEDIFIFANDAAAVSTLIDGGEGAGANTLDLSAQGLINEWLLSGANGGSVSNASNTSGNVFTNIAYLIGGAGQDVFDLQAGGSIAGAIDGGLGADELRVSVEQTSNWQLGGTGGHSVTGIASFTNIESLSGSAGADNFDILAELTDVAQLNGGTGSDAVNFLYDAPVSVDLARNLAGDLGVEGIERFTAVSAESTLVGADSTTSWSIIGADQGSIRYLIETDGDAVNVAFDGFGNLVGGAGDDQFLLSQNGSVSGTLAGGGGRNLVDLQELAGEIHVAAAPDIAIGSGLNRLTLMEIDQLIGNGQTWLYGASDRSYTWTIDGTRSGQMTSTLVDDSNRLLAFENLTAIRGGTHDDIFQVIAESPLLSLDGGSADTADLVDYSQVNGNLRINLADALSGQNGEITGVEGIRGNNAGPDSLHSAELIGPDGGATWSIGDLAGDGLADDVNDGQVAFDDQTITFMDFNVLTGGAGADTFNQSGGVVLGILNGGAGDDVFNVEVMGANAGTSVIGGAGADSLVLRGGDESGLMTYTAAEGGGEFDYSLVDAHYKVSHQGVEDVRDRTLAESLDVRGSSAAETFSLANGRFWVNGGDAVEYSNKRDIAVRSGINDVIEIADNLVVENTLTLANGTVIANDPANNSITAADLILDSTRGVGLSSARLRTSVDNLSVRNSAGDIYLQEQNALNLAEFNANGVFDLRLLNGDLTSSEPLMAADVFRIAADNGDVTLTGANQLRDDVAVSGNRVELHNASTLTLVEINADDLYLRTQRGIEGDGPITVAGLTEIDAGGDVLMDFATNDFNQLRVTNAVNLTVVDQNAIELLDINASGTATVRSTNTVTLNDSVTGSNGVDVSSEMGSIDQNGSITTNSGAVVVTAGNGEVNLGEDARIVSNGGSVSISAGAGNVNMGGDARIAANGGDVNIVAADSVVVAEVVSSGNVSINAGSGSVSDGNGGATNVAAGGLQSSSNTGFGDDDALETDVGNIDISTNSGNVAVSNSGNVTVDNVSTGQGDISLVNVGDVELGGGSVIAEDGANGGSVNIDVSQGSVSQNGPTDVPAVKGGGVVVINAPDGAVGEGGGLRVDAPFVEIIAAIKAGDIFVNPGADKIEYFSGSFKFDDQLLAVEPLEDINPAIFANVKSYFFNDISLLLPRDQLYDEDEEE